MGSDRRSQAAKDDMSVYESFYLLFESNADDVEKGAEEAEKQSDKLEKKLKAVDGQAQKAGDSFTSLAKRAASALLPFLGMSALKGLVFDFAANADAAGTLAKSLKMDVEALQGWQSAAAQAGGSADGFNGSIKNLNGKLEELKRTGGGEAGQVFWRLGVSARDSKGRLKDTESVLLSLADRFENLHGSSAIHFGEKLGLDEGTVALLQKGRKGVEELVKRQRELGVYSKKDAEEARKFNNALADMRQSFQFVAAIIAQALMPMVKGLAEGFTRVAATLRKHKNLTLGFFIALSAILGLMAVKAAIAFAPFLLFAAIILGLAAAFAVLYDDVQAFLNGQNSMIGELSQKYPWLADLVHDLAAAFGFLWEVGKAVFAFLVDSINSPAEAMDNFRAKVDPLINAFCEKFPLAGQALKDIGAIFGWLFGIAKTVFTGIFDFIWKFRDDIIKAIESIFGLFGKGLNVVANLIREGDNPDDPEGGTHAPEDIPQPPDMAAPTPPVYGQVQAAVPDATPLPAPGQVEAGVRAGQMALAATHTPLASRPAAGADAFTKTVNQESHVNVGQVTVQTQAADANGIAASIGGALETQIASAADHFDDGVAG